MKYLLFLLLLVQCKSKTKNDVVKTAYPAQEGYVNDFAGVLTQAEISTLDSALSDFEKQTTNEIVVVTIDSLTSDTTTIETYSLGLAREWGVGKKGANNGLVFLFVMKKRQVRIEVGTGLEKVMTNKQCGAIIDSFIKPNFKTGDYYKGISLALAATMAHLSMYPTKNADR